MQGPLRDCVVFFSPKLEVRSLPFFLLPERGSLISLFAEQIDRQAFATIVEDLGGFVARQYSASVTHFVHSGLKASESFKDFRAAKNDGAYIVHPRWIEEVRLPFPLRFSPSLPNFLRRSSSAVALRRTPPRATFLTPSTLAREVSSSTSACPSPPTPPHHRLARKACRGTPRRARSPFEELRTGTTRCRRLLSGGADLFLLPQDRRETRRLGGSLPSISMQTSPNLSRPLPLHQSPVVVVRIRRPPRSQTRRLLTTRPSTRPSTALLPTNSRLNHTPPLPPFPLTLPRRPSTPSPARPSTRPPTASTFPRFVPKLSVLPAERRARLS